MNFDIPISAHSRSEGSNEGMLTAYRESCSPCSCLCQQPHSSIAQDCLDAAIPEVRRGALTSQELSSLWRGQCLQGQHISILTVAAANQLPPERHQAGALPPTNTGVLLPARPHSSGCAPQASRFCCSSGLPTLALSAGK